MEKLPLVLWFSKDWERDIINEITPPGLVHVIWESLEKCLRERKNAN